MVKVVDYAWSKPSTAALKQAGVAAACRYLSYDTTGKNLTRAEADALLAAGIDVVSNWEWYGNWTDYSGGYATGAQHAKAALEQHQACGGPASAPIYFSVDFQPLSTQMPQVADYFRGAASVLGLPRVGAYGSYSVVRYLFDEQLVTFGWQTYAWSDFADPGSGGPAYLHWDPRAQLRQVQNGITIGGAKCDLDQGMGANFGQWHAPAATLTSISTGGSTVANTIADNAAIAVTTGSSGWVTPAGTDMVNVLPDWFGRIMGALSALSTAVGSLASLDQAAKAELDAAKAELDKLVAAPGLSGQVTVTGTLNVAPPAAG